jgi:phage gp29-like protein
VPETTAQAAPRGDVYIQVGYRGAEFVDVYVRDKRTLLTLLKAPHPHTIRVYYAIIRTDTVARASVRVLRALIRSAAFRFEAEGGTAQDEQFADFLNRMFTRRIQQSLIDALIVGQLMGFRPIQLVWRRDPDGAWGIREAHGENPFFFMYFPALGEWRVVAITDASSHGSMIPLDDPFQWVIYVHEPDVHRWYGNALLESCKKPWFIKRFGLDAWFLAMERYGLLWRTVRVPPEWTEDQLNRLVEALRNTHLDTIIGFQASPTNPDLPEVRAEATASGRANIFADAIPILNREIAHAILGPVLQFMEAEYGTRAQAEVHKDLMEDMLAGIREEFGAFIVGSIVPLIVRANYGDPEARRARLVWEVVQHVDLEEAAKWLSTLIQAGVRVSQKWVARRFGVGEPEDTSDVVPGVPPANVFPVGP